MFRDGLLTGLQVYNSEWFPHQEFLEPKWEVKNQLGGSIESHLRVIFPPCYGLKCHHLFLFLIVCICSLLKQNRIYKFGIMQVWLWLEYWMYLIFLKIFEEMFSCVWYRRLLFSHRVGDASSDSWLGIRTVHVLAPWQEDRAHHPREFSHTRMFATLGCSLCTSMVSYKPVSCRAPYVLTCSTDADQWNLVEYLWELGESLSWRPQTRLNSSVAANTVIDASLVGASGPWLIFQNTNSS